MPRFHVAAMMVGLCLLGLLAGGCTVPVGSDNAAPQPSPPSPAVQAEQQVADPLPTPVAPQPSSTPTTTRRHTATPTPTPGPELSPTSARPALTDTPALDPPTVSPSPTHIPSPLPPMPTATRVPPTASATPTTTAPPTATASPKAATPTPGAHRFLPAGPVQPDPSHPCGCPRAPAYIVGRVTDAAGNPLAGVRLVCYNEWYRYPVVGSKASGEYDFAITQAEATWYVVVLNQVDEPLSPEVPVAFDPQECCRYLFDWQRVD